MEETLYIFPTFISMKYISIPFSFTPNKLELIPSELLLDCCLVPYPPK